MGRSRRFCTVPAGDAGRVTKSPLVTIDTMTLIWGIQRKGPKELLTRTKWLFQQLEDHNAQVIVPSVALSEFLVPVATKSKSAIAQRMADRFIVAPFDLPAALIAAKLFGNSKKNLPDTPPAGTRNILKADTMIVATAAAHGATQFFSHDGKCRKLATAAGMTANDLPEMPQTLYEFDAD